ncbi:MAG: hypothetical protein ACYTXC_25220 [Nostoc sp.]
MNRANSFLLPVGIMPQLGVIGLTLLLLKDEKNPRELKSFVD